MKGIYGIFRKSDDKCMYVGQSADIDGRIRAHLNGSSTNTSFDKENFYGDVIEEHMINDKQFRLERESYWINELNPELNKVRDRHHSEESKKKISEHHADVSGDKNPMYGKTGENNPMFGKHPDHKGEKNPKFGKYFKWINNGTITKHVNQDELDKYIQDGWKLGRLPWKRNL